MQLLLHVIRSTPAFGLVLSMTAVIFAGLAYAGQNPFADSDKTQSFQIAGHHGMKIADTNSDGEISKEEFMQAQERRFQKRDANGDGKLSGDEMGSGKKCQHGKGEHGHGGHGKNSGE